MAARSGPDSGAPSPPAASFATRPSCKQRQRQSCEALILNQSCEALILNQSCEALILNHTRNEIVPRKATCTMVTVVACEPYGTVHRSAPWTEP
eukprot:364531-Chlamydomonas_euryale.AAC.14